MAFSDTKWKRTHNPYSMKSIESTYVYLPRSIQNSSDDFSIIFVFDPGARFFTSIFSHIFLDLPEDSWEQQARSASR